MDKELRAIEFEVLANKAQIICIEVQGMKYANEAQIFHGQDMIYHKDSFAIKAAELQKITESMQRIL